MGLTSLSQKVISKKLINLRCTNFLYEDLWAVIMDEKSSSLVISGWILNQKHFSINHNNNYREEIHTPHLLMYKLVDDWDWIHVYQKVISKKLINLRCTNFLYEDLWAVIMDEKSCSLVIFCWILNQKHFSINQDNNYREEIHTPHLLMYKLVDEWDWLHYLKKLSPKSWSTFVAQTSFTRTFEQLSWMKNHVLW